MHDSKMILFTSVLINSVEGNNQKSLNVDNNNNNNNNNNHKSDNEFSRGFFLILR